MADLPGGGVLLLGGQHGSPPGTALTDFWEWDATGWSRLIEASDVFRPDALTVDTGSGQPVIVFRSSFGITNQWTYDPASGTLEAVATEVTPDSVWGARIAYDSESERIILFGGYDGLRLSDQTWALDLDAGSWKRMAPATSPPPQNYHALAYDPIADRVLLFSTYEADGSTWAYDYNHDTWTDLAPAAGPAERIYTAIAYDPIGQRTILFGGIDAGGSPLGDTWAFDSAAQTWTELTPAEAPSARGWHSMAYDAESERIVLFSGGETRDTDLADVWLFDPRTDTWSAAD